MLVDEAESEWLWHKCVKHHSLSAGSPDRKAYSQAKNIMNDRFNELPLQIGQQIRSTENDCIFIGCKRLYQFPCMEVKNEHTKLRRYILPGGALTQNRRFHPVKVSLEIWNWEFLFISQKYPWTSQNPRVTTREGVATGNCSTEVWTSLFVLKKQ